MHKVTRHNLNKQKLSKQKLSKQNSNTRKKDKKTSQLRIIGGQWRGRKLAIADIPGLRPTGDRIRETLFNWLMADIKGSHCLDLFAGSGALGFESLSRGADHATLLETHPTATQQLRKHCQQFDATNATIIQQDAITWLANHSIKPHSINIAFIDPPFADNLWQACLEQVNQSHILSHRGLIYIEMPKEKSISPPKQWQLHREKTAGDICYRLYRNIHSATAQC